MKQRVLIVDDDETIVRTVEYHLGQAGYSTLTAASGDVGLQIAEAERPDIIVTDLRLPGIDGLELVAKAHSLDRLCVIIVISAHGSIETAVEAMKLGAFDFITKPFGRDDLLRVVERAFRVHGLIHENINLRSLALERYRFDRIITASPAMKRLIETAGRVAQTDSTVLISGDSGTGKELLARAVHFSSARSEGPFYPVNLGAVPETLVDSALFGHRKGAFTGAVESRSGAFEEAEGGTLFLDEVGELKLDTQVKLLRVLQEREYMRLGETKPRNANVRIVSATNRDLEAEVKEGRFREDLYYRLCVVPLAIPPLRHRREDIPMLVQHFLAQLAERSNRPGLSISPLALDRLSEHDWPGNVRQLENMVERLVTLNTTGTIDVDEIPVEIGGGTGVLSKIRMSLPPDGIPLEEVEKALIQEALSQCNQNQTKAAEFLRITRNTLLYRMEKFGLQKRK